MHVGLYFGSFNPIHIGHLIIANHILNETSLQQVWFVVSPLNPFKEQETLLNEYKRLDLVKTATADHPQLKVTDIEFSLPKPSYTVHTLAYLREKYPQHQFTIIMGGDSFQNLPRWKNVANILSNHSIIVYNRPGFELKEIEGARVEILNAPLLEISATHIRQLIKEGKSIRYLVTPEVEREIENGGYFKKGLRDNLK